MRHHGREVDTAGDGFFAVFDGPPRAVRCAAVLAHAVGELDWTSGQARTPAKWSSGARKSRAWPCTSAHASRPSPARERAWSPRAAEDLVVGSGLEFEEWGTQQLKCVPDSWPLYRAVEGAG